MNYRWYEKGCQTFFNQRKGGGMMNSTNEKDFVVFSQRLAGYLMLNSCKLKKISKSKQDDTKFVYFFNDTETVRNLVEQYK
jgi:hypothetical protein